MSGPAGMQLGLRARLLRLRLKEWVFFECRWTRFGIALGGYVAGLAALHAGRHATGTNLLATIHRASLWGWVDRRIEALFRDALAGGTGRACRGIAATIDGFDASVRPEPNTQRYHEQPSRLLRGCMIVLKSATPGEKGVLYFYYSYVYPLFMKLFDGSAVAQRYHFVLEPSWTGFCDLNVLSSARLGHPVFVGYGEPRDADFLTRVHPGFRPVEVTGNTWVDIDTFFPVPGTPKDFDVVVVAAWAWYKRHWAIFEAVRTLKRRGRRVRVALVGYPIDMSKDEVLALIRLYDIEGQVEIFERISQPEVNLLLNRSKVKLLWARREGSNRAIVEAMAADVPCIVRRGFNYGHPYAHVNPQTGCFADDGDLPDVLARMIDTHASFSPRAWMRTRMTPEASTERLNAAIGGLARETGEPWTRDLAVKVSTLDRLMYRDESLAAAFEPDYVYIESKLRRAPPELAAEPARSASGTTA